MVVVLLVGVPALILMNAFFVAAEYALVRSRLDRIQALVKEGTRGATLAERQIAHIDQYIAAGSNFPAVWACLATGRPLPPLTAARAGVRFQWLEGALRRAAGNLTEVARRLHCSRTQLHFRVNGNPALRAVRDEVKNRLGTDTLELLQTEPVPWQLHECWGSGLKWQPVLTESTICWRRYTIDLALNVNGAKLSDEMLALLDVFEKVISASPHTIDFMMQERELLFSDNRKQIHSRTAIDAGDASDRLMIRSWINTS